MTVALVVALNGMCAAYGVRTCAALPPIEHLAPAGHTPVRLVEPGRIGFAIVGRFKEEAAVRGPEGQPLSTFRRNAVRRAANVLVEAFEKCCGVKPQVLEESDPKVAQFEYVIALGNTRYSEALGMKPYALPREGFEVRTFEKGVAIGGMDGFRIDGFYDTYAWRSSRFTCNGTEWGAIDFVERFLGVRKFSLLDERLWSDFPKAETLVLAPVAYRDHPRTWFRAGYANEGWRAGISDDWFGGEAPSPFDLAKAHPDKIDKLFYRDANGKLWQNDTIYSENFMDVTGTALAETIVDDYVKHYAQRGTGTYWKAAHPITGKILYFGQCDRGMAFDTPRAKALPPRENPVICDANSEIYGHFYNRLAKLCDEKLPGKTLVLMAYSSYLKPPRTVKKFPDNVQILCCVATPALVKCEPYMAELLETYKAWNALCAPDKKCVPYIYHLCYSDDGGPLPQLMQGLCMGEFLRKTDGVRDPNHYYPCLGNFSKKAVLPAYLTYRSGWNPDYDAHAGLADFMTRMFGSEAGAHLIRFAERLEQRWNESYIPSVAQEHIGTKFRSIPWLVFKSLYLDALNPAALNALEKELAAAEAALGENPLRRERFGLFTQPYRKTFADARGYQALTCPTFAVKRGFTRGPAFGKGFLGGEVKVNPVAEIKWGEEGITLRFESPAPYKKAAHLFDGDSLEFFLAPGEEPANLYQFVLSSSGKYEDFHMQLDQPRAMDANWKCAGVKYVSNCGEGGWSGELFIPWRALYDAKPKTGDFWKVNVISNRTTPSEYASWSPTLNNNRRHALYAKIRFEE